MRMYVRIVRTERVVPAGHTDSDDVAILVVQTLDVEVSTAGDSDERSVSM